ncbi:PF04305 family protein [Bacteriovorax sp. BAL6_X]|uniref:DUF455 family protein n=1 Tax=Bacteriovorax sp. BAL6_X TaxID=1201290 RepID=UPI000385F3BC|nr:DUF455 family protein [Bacteriovorax sp. BAL6_X]EPZ51704.1 PF04305 family protein [Bacteriovorax sp. BAL6_X]
MNTFEYARLLLESPFLEDKLTTSAVVTDLNYHKTKDGIKDLRPAREGKIIFSCEQLKFPKRGSFHLDEKKATALHFFANHELLAIEMMATALMYIPIEDKSQYKRIASGLLQTIDDEIKHFNLYRKRMNDFGIDFGDLPVNDFFWRQMQKITSFEEYFAVMALTFEAANLDFAKFYRDIFQGVDDKKSAAILNVVYEDEISHVGFGVHWLNKWRNQSDLWEFYVQSLPDLLSPARAKGMIFDREGRVRTGMDDDFISRIENFKDEFIVTNRKEWK